MLEAVPSTPIPRLSLQESPHSAEVSFMSKEISILGSFRPELDSIGQCIHCLSMTTNETSTEIDVLEIVLFGLQIRYLANVVASGVNAWFPRDFEGQLTHLTAYNRLRLTSSALKLCSRTGHAILLGAVTVDKPTAIFSIVLRLTLHLEKPCQSCWQWYCS